jgi:NAD+ kinase
VWYATGVDRVGFVLKRDKPEAEAIARELVPWLQAEGREVVVLPEAEGLAPGVTVASEDVIGARVDIMVVLGGDGTLLRGAALAADHGVPVLGVNLGALGFLVPFAPVEARSALERALAGTLPYEDRMRLRVRLGYDGGVTERTALNDAVIAQGSMARLVELAVTLDDQEVARYKADGLIICTPTGSTAYNLAAGGPILPPAQASLAITPICPHTLTHRPLVVAATARIAVEIGAGAGGVMLTVDGQWGYPLAPGDRVEVLQSPAPLRLYRSVKGYFEILREKLSWGSRSR